MNNINLNITSAESNLNWAGSISVTVNYPSNPDECNASAVVSKPPPPSDEGGLKFWYFKIYGSIYDILHKEPQELVKSCGIDYSFFVPAFSFEETRVTMNVKFYKIKK